MDLVTSAIKIGKMGIERCGNEGYWDSDDVLELQERLRGLSGDLTALPLGKIPILVRGLLEDLRDHPTVHNILVEQPEVLVPLRPAIPEVSWTEYVCMPTAERPTWKTRLAGWWSPLLRWPEVHIAGLEELRRSAAGIVKGRGTVIEDLALLRSALDLLSPGENALFLTENPSVLAGALELLAGNRHVGLIRFSPTPMNEWGLQMMGLDPSRYAPFTWAYLAVFQMR